MNRNGLSWMAGVVLMVAAGFQPAARAGELKLWPDAFRADGVPVNGESTNLLTYQSPAGVTVILKAKTKDSWEGWAPVTLPVGTQIKSLSYYHGGGASGLSTACLFYRVKFGGTLKLVAFTSSESAAAGVLPLSVPDPALLTIKTGYRYFMVMIAERGMTARGVKITY